MTAQEMFRELGFIQEVHNELIMYFLNKISEKMIFTFNCKTKSYHVTYARFIPKDYGWHEMVETGRYKKEDGIHSCKYGHWQSETIVDLGVMESLAIYEQMKELGWLDE